MFPEEKFSYLDFDLYSRRISFFYKNKEKIGSTFGFILTLLYLFLSIILFSIYFINIINRKNLTASDSTIYPKNMPSININNDSFNLAFGIEHPIYLNRFIDERIYYPKVFYIRKIKENGEYKIDFQKELNFERCKYDKLGKNNEYLFESNQLNNSYCLKDFNITLKGGFKYDEMSLIRINIYPCVNSTENNNHCKPQNIIDKSLSSTYFSILSKDIGLNPFNFSFPTVPIVQDLYTSIDKSILKEFIIYYGITEINTDIGLFSSKIKKEIYFKYIKDFHAFHFLRDEEYKLGKEIVTAEIRLEDNIHFQNRTYEKMSYVFSTTGGYMQVIYTIFGLIALLSKKISLENKLLNNLFNFNIKQRKIILCIEYKKKLDYISSLDKNNNNFIQYQAKKSLKKRNRTKKRSSNLLFYGNNNFEKIIKKSENGENNIPPAIKDMKSQNNISESGLVKIFQKISKEKDQNNNLQELSINKSGVNMIYKESNSNLNELQLNRVANKNGITKRKSNFEPNMFKEFKISDNKNWSTIDFNIFDYYCLRKFTQKRREIELFRFGINFYKSQMDIINFINIILLTQIMLTHQTEEKHNILNQTIELSIE